MEASLFTFAHDVVDAGAGPLMDDVLDRAGADAVLMAVTYHDGRDLFPHGRAGKVRYLEPGSTFFQPDPAAYRDSPQATPGEMERFHHPDYLAALARAERDQRVDAETGARYNLGKLENPVYPEMYRRPAISAGAAILAGRMLAGAPGVIYSPASGTHHARPGRASGFCYILAYISLALAGVLVAAAVAALFIEWPR